MADLLPTRLSTRGTRYQGANLSPREAERARMQAKAQQSDAAFSDAFATNFPQYPTLDQQRTDYAKMLWQNGRPIDEALAEAEMAIQPPVKGSALPPTGLSQMERAVLDRAEAMGQGGDTELIHINKAEYPIVRRALKDAGGSGTINPWTGKPEFGGGGGTINGAGGSGNVGGGGRGNAGGGGPGNTGRGEQSRTNTQSGQQQGPWGNRLTTSYGAPIHTDKYGSYALNPTKWGAMVDQVNTYNEAANKWNKSAAQRSLNNLVNNVSPFGLSMQAPEYNRPATYTGGDYHMGVNWGNLIGGLAGGMIVPGGGIPAGAIGGALYSGLGLKDSILTGPDVPGGWDQNGTASNSGASPSSGPNQGGPSGGSTGNGGSFGAGGSLLPPIVGNPQPAAPSAPIPPQAPTPAAYPGRYFSIPGPSAYGWQRPAWMV